MTTSSRPPTPVIPDDPVREDLPKPLRQFKFVNRSRYTVLLAWGWDEQIVELDPDYVLEPYTSQILVPERPQDRFVYLADTDWGMEAARQSGTDSFSWVATDKISNVAAVSNSALDIISQPPTNLTGTNLDMSRVIDTQEDAERDTVIAKLEADAVNRLRIKNTGRFYIGNGVNPVVEKFLGLPAELFTNFPDDYAGSAGAPSVYPLGGSIFKETDGVGGWPTSAGMIITYRQAGSAATLQIYADNATQALYWRSGAAGDTWQSGGAFNQFSNVAYVQGQISGVIANYQAADVVIRDLAFAYTDAMLAVISPATTAGWNDTNAVKYRVGKNKQVMLEGQVKNISGAVKTPPNIIFMVGAAYRPATTHIFRAPQFSTANGWVAAMAALYLNPAGEFGLISQNVPIDNEINFGGLSWAAP